MLNISVLSFPFKVKENSFREITGSTQGIRFKIKPPRKASKIYFNIDVLVEFEPFLSLLDVADLLGAFPKFYWLQ